MIHVHICLHTYTYLCMYTCNLVYGQQMTAKSSSAHPTAHQFSGQNAMSYTLLRILTSKVVYHHVQESKVATRFIVTVVRCWSIHKLQLPLYEVYGNSLLLVLWKIPWLFTQFQAGSQSWPQCFEGSLAPILQGQIGLWVSWPTVLQKCPHLQPMMNLALQARQVPKPRLAMLYTFFVGVVSWLHVPERPRHCRVNVV